MFYFFTSFDVFCFTFDVFAFDVFVHLMLKTSNAHVLSKSCQGDWSLTYYYLLLLLLLLLLLFFYHSCYRSMIYNNIIESII